jgi:branched-chain amino acid transport system permease protein
LHLPLLLLLGWVVLTFVTSSTVLSLFTQAVIYAIFALGIGVLLKQNGMVSFGHALYFGSAGYLMGIMPGFNGHQLSCLSLIP